MDTVHSKDIGPIHWKANLYETLFSIFQSFNDIAKISEDILEFPALKMLYLHGNKIRWLKRRRRFPDFGEHVKNNAHAFSQAFFGPFEAPASQEPLQPHTARKPGEMRKR